MRGNLACRKRSTGQPYTPRRLAQALAWDRLADIRKLCSAVNLNGLGDSPYMPGVARCGIGEHAR
jgi:hypothetical protein